MELVPVFEQVAADLDAQLISFEQLTGGSSATVYALDLNAAGEARRVVFRQYPQLNFKGHAKDSVAVEFGVLESLHGAGFPVAAPLLLATADQFLITEWVEGTTEVSPERLHQALDHMVDFLVALHALDPATLTVELPELEDPVAASLKYLSDIDAGQRAHTALTDASLVENGPVMIHGDYWPGNVLWHQGQLAAVIDWEDVQLGDPLADLACARVELLCQYGPQAMTHFTQRYLSQTRVVADSLPVWEIYVSSSALATMHMWGLDAGEEARRRAATTAFLERALEQATSS